MKRTIRRRRLEAKTDYATRLALLSSRKPRLVIRKTNKRIIMQIVQSNIAQDSIIVQADSSELVSLGWPKEMTGSLKNRAAAYLTGWILGNKAKGKISDCIVDFGMYRNIHKSRLYAALKGAVDAGLKIPHSAQVLPEMELIAGEDKKFAAVIETVKKHK